MNTKNLFLSALIAFIMLGCNHQSNKNDSSAKGGFSPADVQVKFEDNGYLDPSIISELRDEHLSVKAISAYEYALSIVAVEVWNKGFLKQAKHGDWLIYDNQESKIPILTANTTTPYVISFLDLSTSNYYLEIPAGPIGGLVNDIYQTPVSDLGILGPDAGKGGKYLLVGPEGEVPEDHDAEYVVKSGSNLVLIGTRIIGLSDEEYKKALKAHRLYKVGANREDQKFIQASTSAEWMGNQPHGLTYWEDLNRVLQNEPVVGRNRFILTQLRDIGIEKGVEFEPTQKQKEILINAEKKGNAMAMVNTFSRDSYKEKHWPNRNWLYVMNMKHLDQMHPNYYEVKEIASYSYEAVTTSKAMILNNVGSGSKYLGAYIDDEGNWLDGNNNYEIIVPKDAPANQFWSITIYDNDSRCIIQNEQGKSDISSVMKDLKVEADGSTKIYIGEKAPKGYENNWIQSNPKKGFFAYLRLYGPLESFYDKSWVMPNVKKIK